MEAGLAYAGEGTTATAVLYNMVRTPRGGTIPGGAARWQQGMAQRGDYAAIPYGF